MDARARDRVCFVEKKLDVVALDPDDVIPPLLDGVPTDVQESPMFQPCATPTGPLQQQIRPLVGGLQWQVNQGLGTLGFIGVFGGIMVAVSNQHVLASLAAMVSQPTTGKNLNVGTTHQAVLSPDVDAGHVFLLSGASGQSSRTSYLQPAHRESRHRGDAAAFDAGLHACARGLRFDPQCARQARQSSAACSDKSES